MFLLAARLACSAAQEIEPHMLEIPGKAIDQQALPRVGRAHPLGSLLRPVEPQPCADITKSAGQDRRRGSALP